MKKSTSTVRLVARSFILGVASLVCAALILPASAGAAGGHVFTQYSLTYGCCNGDPLRGTHASIQTPSPAISGYRSHECSAFRSEAEGNNSGLLQLIQAGFARCGTDAGGIDGSCATVNPQVEFIEIATDTIGTPDFECYSQGTIGNGVDVKYGVRQDTNTATWHAWINGAEYTQHDVVFSSASPQSLILEGWEFFNDGTQDPCTSPVSVPPVWYGLSTLWQRLDATWSWHTVAHDFVGVEGQIIGGGGGFCTPQFGYLSAQPPDSWYIHQNY